MIKHILNKLRDVVDPLLSKKINSVHLNMSSSSILLKGSRLDFRTEIENRKYVTIGERGLIKSTFTFETATGEIIIGNGAYINGVHFICRTKIEIGDDVGIAWGSTVYDHDSHSLNWDERKNDFKQGYQDYISHNGNDIANKDWTYVNAKPIKICSKAWIGFDVLILKGVTIGEGAIVAAKSVVTKDVPAWTLVAGNPARIIRELNRPHGL